MLSQGGQKRGERERCLARAEREQMNEGGNQGGENRAKRERGLTLAESVVNGLRPPLMPALLIQ
jgi:hypothetical protein